VAITGSLPKKANNHAVPISIDEQVDMHWDAARLAKSNAELMKRAVDLCTDVNPAGLSFSLSFCNSELF
jgi:uncharacterized protein (DUF849 family)